MPHDRPGEKFERLARGTSTRANMVKQMRELELDKGGASTVSSKDGPTPSDRGLPKKGPNKFTVERKPGENLKEHMARVRAAREKAGFED